MTIEDAGEDMQVTAEQREDDKRRIVVGRLVRLRKDSEHSQPSKVIAQLEIQGPNGVTVAEGTSELQVDGEEALVPGAVWTAAEEVLELAVAEFGEELPAGAISILGNIIDAQEDEAIEPFSPRGKIAYRLITDAISSALSVGLGIETNSAGNTDIFDAKILNRAQKYAVAPVPVSPTLDGNEPNSYSDAPFIEPLPKDGTKGHLLEREALKYGLASTRFPNGAFVINDDEGHRLAFKWGRSPLASGVALSICSYKEATRRLLEQVDVPVAKGRVFSVSDIEAAADYAEHIGYPVVIKPSAGLRGIGVVTDIQDRQGLLEAFEVYKDSEMGNDDFVLEEQVPGEDYRIVIIGDEVVASGVREPASVIGDGVHTVADLIEFKNRLRKKNPHLSSRLIKLSSAVEFQLARAGLTYGSVPAKGQKVTLANTANLSVGGDSFEVTDELHPSIKELAVKAVKAVPGLGFCGLDMLIEDRTKPVWEQQVTVIELNAHAAIGTVQYPMWGTPAPVSKIFFEETARQAEINLPPEQTDELCLDLVVRGKVTRVGYRRWFAKLARRFGLTGYVKNVRRGRVEAHICGPADGVTALAYEAVRGSRRSVPTSVETTPSSPKGYTDFQELRKGSAVE